LLQSELPHLIGDILQNYAAPVLSCLHEGAGDPEGLKCFIQLFETALIKSVRFIFIV
jgi:hypothetical protein